MQLVTPRYIIPVFSQYIYLVYQASNVTRLKRLAENPTQSCYAHDKDKEDRNYDTQSFNRTCGH